MDKKFPTVVNIGGRRYVKNNLNKSTDNSKTKLKDVARSFGRRIQKSQLTQCIIDHDNEMDIYGSTDIKVIFSRSNKPVGFLVTGKAENINKNKYGEVPDDLESTVEEINKASLEEASKEQESVLDVD